MSTTTKWQQEVFVGGRVRWDVSTGEGERYVMEGRVVALDPHLVVVQPTRRMFWSAEHRRMIGEDCPDAPRETIKRTYFDAPLEERIEEAADFWAELAWING